ncbi:MAG: GGDEF domain-containing protein, partial [Ruminococcus sp.]|nr:GGDEF domain-containing protein [Ruminococcus sp.]
ISGDEFAVILSDNNKSQDIINFAGQVQSIFFEPVNVDGKAIGVSSSIGIAMFPRDASDAEEIFRCAEKAMFMSKNNGKNKICFFSPVV